MQNKEKIAKRVVIHKSRLNEYSALLPEVVTYYGELSEATYVPPKVVNYLCKVYLKDLKKLCKNARKATEFTSDTVKPSESNLPVPINTEAAIVTTTDSDNGQLPVPTLDGLVAEKVIVAAMLKKEE